MATRYASQNGNWSAVGTWDGGATLPASGDTVVANGVTVTIDQNATVTQVRTLELGSGATVGIVAAGAITSVSAAPPSGGSGYPVSSTFTLAVTGGGGTGGRVTATTNSSGVIISYATTPAAAGSGYITNAAAATSSSGGGFTLNDARTLTANVLAGTTTCLTFSAASPATASIVGTVDGTAGSATVNAISFTGTGQLSVTGRVRCGSTGGGFGHGIVLGAAGTLIVVGNAETVLDSHVAQAIRNLAGGSVTITGNLVASTTVSTAACVLNASTGSITVIGNITGGSGIGGSTGIDNTSTGSVTITGSVTGGSSGSASVGIAATGTGSITVTGDVTATATSSGIVVSAAGVLLTVTGTLRASTFPAVQAISVTAYNRFSGPFIDSTLGVISVYCYRFALARESVLASTSWAFAKASGTVLNYDGYRSLYSAGTATGHPATANVRDATAYGPTSELTGTLKVPLPAYVSLGVLTDNTVGTLTSSGGGGTNPSLLQATTIATLATQTSFTLAAGSPDNNSYIGQQIIIQNASTATKKAVATVSAYVGSTRTITLAADPALFTMAVGDTINIVAGPAGGLAGSVNTTHLNGTAQTARNIGAAVPAAVAGAAGGLSIVGSQMDLVNAPNATAVTAFATRLEAAILDEGDATALLAAISAKIETFLINEGDATATIAAIATACNAAVTTAHGSGSYQRNTEPETGLATGANLALVKAETAAIKLKTDNLTSDPAGLANLATAHGAGSWATAVGFATINPDNTGIANAAASAATAAAQATAATAATTTILDRIGAFTGTGLNTILGFFRAAMSKAPALTPSDVGGTFDNASASLEAVAESSGLSAPQAAQLAATLKKDISYKHTNNQTTVNANVTITEN